MKAESTRLDQYLHANALAPSRERARALIMAGIVYINGTKAEKAGVLVPNGATVEVRGKDLAYVSRGGLKLARALAQFPIDLQGLICMDVGASTGGFTDCMLQNGARKVYAVDVGYGQLAWKLRCDKRVVNLERTNIRNLQPEALQEKIDFFSVDVSFISLKHIFPVLEKATTSDATGVCLVKPQFEAGREKIGKKGVVREANTHIEVLQAASMYAVQHSFTVLGLEYSPIKGPEGNIEFLMYVQHAEMPNGLATEQCAQIVIAAHAALHEGSAL